MLTTAVGPLFIDFETTCRGPVELDLAHVPEAVCPHHPGVNRELLDDCRHLVQSTGPRSTSAAAVAQARRTTDHGRMTRRRALPALALLVVVGPVSWLCGCESPPPPPEPLPRVVVTLWHCGVNPLTFDGQVWEAGPATIFDQTNAPSEWVGTGTITRPAQSELVYRDDSGIEVRFVPEVSERVRVCA